MTTNSCQRLNSLLYRIQAIAGTMRLAHENAERVPVDYTMGLCSTIHGLTDEARAIVLASDSADNSEGAA